MSTTTTLVKFLILTSCVSLIQADVSLYLPGFDPQPLTASVLGVDSNGDTTYLIQAGTPTGNEDPSDQPPFTLVEGASNVGYTIVVPDAGTVAESCTYIGNGQANCVLSMSGSGVNDEGVFTTTDTVASIAVQGGEGGGAGNGGSSGGGAASVTPAPSGSGSGSGSGSAPSQTAAPGSGTKSGSSTGTGTPPAKTGSSASAIKPSFVLFAAVAALLV